MSAVLQVTQAGHVRTIRLNRPRYSALCRSLEWRYLGPLVSPSLTSMTFRSGLSRTYSASQL